ncbi:hypothetical protein RG903_04515 [Thermithiobacillus tepidarius DSM 3134]|nr:hypothetical protein [Thermithiobacillus tepidarius]
MAHPYVIAVLMANTQIEADSPFFQQVGARFQECLPVIGMHALQAPIRRAHRLFGGKSQNRDYIFTDPERRGSGEIEREQIKHGGAGIDDTLDFFPARPSG